MAAEALITNKIQWHPNLSLVDISLNLRKKLFDKFNLKLCIVAPLIIHTDVEDDILLCEFIA